MQDETKGVVAWITSEEEWLVFWFKVLGLQQESERVIREEIRVGMVRKVGGG